MYLCWPHVHNYGVKTCSCSSGAKHFSSSLTRPSRPNIKSSCTLLVTLVFVTNVALVFVNFCNNKKLDLLVWKTLWCLNLSGLSVGSVCGAAPANGAGAICLHDPCAVPALRSEPRGTIQSIRLQSRREQSTTSFIGGPSASMGRQ